MRSGNPALSEKAFERFDVYDQPRTMTVEGTTIKTGVLLALVVVPAVYTWDLAAQNPAAAYPWMIGGAIVGFIFALATIFKPNWSPVTAPLYAIAEGFFLGAISSVMNQRFDGIVFPAVCLTFGTLFCMLIAYQTGFVRATEKFKMGVVAATGAVMLVYLVSMVLGMFGVAIPMIHSNGPVGIIFSAVVVVIAALNLVLDFDFIEKGAERGAPKFMEWYGAFGLMVTLVWLYLEILRLLSKLRGRN